MNPRKIAGNSFSYPPEIGYISTSFGTAPDMTNPKASNMQARGPFVPAGVR